MLKHPFGWRSRIASSASTAAIALLLLSDASLAQPKEESPKELIRRYFETCFATEKPGCLEEYWSAEHAENIRRGAKRRRNFFPDISYALRELIAEGERVVAVFRVAGTAADSEGSETDGVLDHHEVAIYTVRDSRIISGEVIADLLAVTRALGQP